MRWNRIRNYIITYTIILIVISLCLSLTLIKEQQREDCKNATIKEKVIPEHKQMIMIGKITTFVNVPAQLVEYKDC